MSTKIISATVAILAIFSNTAEAAVPVISVPRPVIAVPGRWSNTAPLTRIDTLTHLASDRDLAAGAHPTPQGVIINRGQNGKAISATWSAATPACRSRFPGS